MITNECIDLIASIGAKVQYRTEGETKTVLITVDSDFLVREQLLAT